MMFHDSIYVSLSVHPICVCKQGPHVVSAVRVDVIEGLDHLQGARFHRVNTYMTIKVYECAFGEQTYFSMDEKVLSSATRDKITKDI